MLDYVKVRVLPGDRLCRREAAKFLGRTPKTLAEWSRLGIGPLPRKVNGRVFYRLPDCVAFRDTGARVAQATEEAK